MCLSIMLSCFCSAMASLALFLFHSFENHAVRSCSNFAKCSYTICWWLGRSGCRCPRFLWVNPLWNYYLINLKRISNDWSKLMLAGLISFFQIRLCYVLWCHCRCLHSNSVCGMCFRISVLDLLLVHQKNLLNYLLFQAKYRERVLGLILVSPLCKGPTWTEWLYSKVALLQMTLWPSDLHIYQKWLY